MFKMISQDNCSFCERAKALLHSLDLPFTEIKLDTDSKKKAFANAGFTTVPQIYHGEYLIGGFTDLRDVIQELVRKRFE